MLARSTYEQDYIDTCRTQVDAQVKAFTTLVAAAPADAAAAFEPTGYAPGDRIAVRRDDFVRLADAFFADLEKKFR